MFSHKDKKEGNDNERQQQPTTLNTTRNMARLSKWNHVGVNHHHFILTTRKNRQSPPNTVSHKQKGITTWITTLLQQTQ